MGQEDKKKVLFIGPVFYDYHTIIKEKIENLNSEVHFYPEKKYGLLFGVLNTLSTNFIVLTQKIHYLGILRAIKKEKYTHLFVVRGEKMPVFAIEKIKEMNPSIRTLLYQWDSNRNNSYFHLVPYFDQTFTFDYKDYNENKRLKLLQLFYTDDIKKISDDTKAEKYDYFVFFSFTMNRYNDMLRFKRFCEENNRSFKLFCFIPKSTFLKFKYLKRINLDKALISFDPMPREEYLRCLRDCKVVVDFSHSTQTGLSMRIIESYGAGKKILTTNRSFKENPIYSGSWVQIVNVENIQEPIFGVRSGIRSNQELYIDNWIESIFE